MSKVLLRSIDLNVNIYQKVYVGAKRDVKIGLTVQPFLSVLGFRAKNSESGFLRS